MYLRTHTLAKRGINELMPLNWPLMLECRRNNRGEKMLAVALYFDMLANELSLNVFLHLFGSRQHKNTLYGEFDMSEESATKLPATSRKGKWRSKRKRHARNIAVRDIWAYVSAHRAFEDKDMTYRQISRLRCPRQKALNYRAIPAWGASIRKPMF